MSRERLAALFDLPEGTAIERGSPLYRHLIAEVAADVRAGGPSWALLERRAGEPRGHVLPVRLMTAVHRLVLAGDAPELARHYPSAGGGGPVEDAWPAFRAVLEEHRRRLDALLDEPLQTNEVGRAAALVVGFETVARATRLPLRLLELGASAGLLLNAHRHVGRPLDVAEARGCDRRPLDPADPADALVLRASVWADQLDRLERLDRALAVAREHPVPVDRADALEWAAAQLAEEHEGVATVLFHSVFAQYLTHAARDELAAIIRAAGTHATPERPLAWLRLEATVDEHREERFHALAELSLATWPGGDDRVLARVGFHGHPVELA